VTPAHDRAVDLAEIRADHEATDALELTVRVLRDVFDLPAVAFPSEVAIRSLRSALPTGLPAIDRMPASVGNMGFTTEVDRGFGLGQ